MTDVLSQNVLVDANGVPISTMTTTIQVTSSDVIWNPIQHVLFIYRYHGPGGIVIEESYAPYQYAWNWILPIDPFNSPTYYGVSVMVSTPTGVQEYSPILYVSQANLPLWYGIWPAIAGLAVAFMRKKEWPTALFMGVGIAANYLPWVTLSLLTRRIGFNYYMIFTLPYIALAFAFTWRMLPPKIGKIALAANLLASLAFFIWFFPVHPAP